MLEGESKDVSEAIMHMLDASDVTKVRSTHKYIRYWVPLEKLAST